MLKQVLGAMAAVAMVVGAASESVARDQIKIVGSSTVYPFSTAVAEEFGNTTRYKAPTVESTGSGGGHKLFAAGVGPKTPDITNSSRKMKESEFELGQKNGVGPVVEAVIGYDGIAIAHNAGSDKINFKPEHIVLAVAAEVPNADGSGLIKNPHKNWSDIDKSLPNKPIKIYGPPATSGTRDAFEELALEAVTKKMKGYGGKKYGKVRQDGPWIDGGENDSLLVQKLDQDKDAFGVFGYSFLAENRDKIQGATVGGVPPTPETISSGDYPVSRSLYFYIKRKHLAQIPGLYEYVKLFMSDKMIGPDGYLKKIGLVPLPDHLRKASQQRVLKAVPLQLKDGKLETLEDYAKANGFTKK